jgi:hypothetical protein
MQPQQCGEALAHHTVPSSEDRPMAHVRNRILALAVTSLLLGACDQPLSPSNENAGKAVKPQGPSFSAGLGFASTTIGRANLGEINWNSNFNGFNVELKTHDDADVEVITGVANAGGHNGWHYHPGPVLTLVKSGTVTIYRADDPTCTGIQHPAGTTFVEGTEPHILRNEGVVNAEIVAVFFVPAGQPRRIEADVPGNCPF